MKRSSRSAFPMLLGLALSVAFAQPLAVVAQSPNQQQPVVESKAAAADSSATLQQRALDLLNQLSGQTNDFGGFAKAAKAAVFQAEVADTLWDYDQTRARLLFETAIKSAAAQVPKPPAGKPISMLQMQVQETSVLYREIVAFALARDAALAERLVSLALLPLPTDDPKGEGFDRAYRSERAALYSQIAKRIAASDPQHAVDLIRISFNGWYSGEQISALSALRRHAPQLADEIFVNILTMIRNKPTSISNKAGILAPYVFPDIKTGDNSPPDRASDAGLQAEVSPALARRFLEFVYDSFTPQPVAAQTAENNEFGFAAFDRDAMEELAPRFERYLPDKADSFRARIEEVVANIKKAGRQDMFDRESEAWGEMLGSSAQDWACKAEAAKTPKERDYYYHQAIGVLMYKDGDLEQAVALLNKMSDSDFSKPYTLKTIREAQARKAIAEGDAEQAYRYARMVQPVKPQDEDTRPDLFMAVARRFAQNGNAERAKAVLAEASQMMATQRRNEYLILDRATVAVEIGPAYGFQIMKEAIEAMNAGNPGGKHEGIGYGGDTGITYLYRHGFDENLAVLARTDFGRALELARSLKSKEASLLAQFAICKSLLGKAGTQSGSVQGKGIRK